MEGLPEWVQRLEVLAHGVRAAWGVPRPSVAAGASPEARALLGELREVVATRYGRVVAEEAVTDWLLTDRPVGDVVAWHRLVPDTRVTRAGRGSVVVAPADGAADLECRADALFLRVWVAWDGGGTELVRVASLEA